MVSRSCKCLTDAETFLPHIGHAAAVLDPEGAVVAGNEPFAALLEADIAGLVGQDLDTCDFVISAMDLKQCLYAITKAPDADQGPIQSHLRLRSGHASMAISPLVQDGALCGFLCQANPKMAHNGIWTKYLIDHLDQGIWEFEVPQRNYIVSDTWRAMHHVAADVDVNAVGEDWINDVHPQDRETLRRQLDEQIIGTRRSLDLQFRKRVSGDRWIWIHCRSATVEHDENGAPLRIVGTDTDVSRLKDREANHRDLQRKLELALKASGIGVWDFDPVAGRVHWDDRMLEIYGLADGENDRPSLSWETYLHPDDLEETVAHAERCSVSGEDFQRDYRVVRPDGEVRYVRSRARQVSPDDRHARFIGVNIDVTEDYMRAQELEHVRSQLEHDSRHDALTGLANRRLLDETTLKLFRSMGAGRSYAVLHLDLDHFKHVNDTLGHAAGDAVLVHVAKVLTEIVGDTGLTCRIGGDEFAILFETAPSKVALDTLCETIIAQVRKPIHYDNEVCSVGVSIGCALGHGPLEDKSKIFIDADIALYAAKEAGRNCFRVLQSAV